MSDNKKKTNDKADIKVAIRYGVDIPERELRDLIRLDCAKKILTCEKAFGELNGIFQKNGAKLPLSVIDNMIDLHEALAVSSEVLAIVQEAWRYALEDYVDKEKTARQPKGKECKKCQPSKEVKKSASPAKKNKKSLPKSGLSPAEQNMVRSLRLNGLSIKAIGKEIHRNEKVVADFVRRLPKK